MLFRIVKMNISDITLPLEIIVVLGYILMDVTSRESFILLGSGTLLPVDIFPKWVTNPI